MVQDINKLFTVVRTAVFGVVTVFAFLELALAAALTNWTNTTFRGQYYSFAALAIATSIFTLLTLPAMYFLSVLRKGAVVTMIAIELGWTAFLWILWLAVGSSAASFQWVTDCSNFVLKSTQAACRESQAITAFGFLTWIPLFAFNIFLLTLVLRQQMRGNSLWTSYIGEADFNAAGVISQPGAPQAYNVEPKVAAPQFAPQYPPVQQNAQPNYAQSPAPQQAGSPYPQV